MNHRIEIGLKEKDRDSSGKALQKRIAEDLGINVEAVRTADVYTLEGELGDDQVSLLSNALFVDPIIQDAAIDNPIYRDFDWEIEVGFKPGVTDNVGKTAKDAIEDVLGKKIENLAVYTSKKYFIRGKGLSKESLETVVKNFLANEQIQRWLVSDAGSGGQNLPAPKVNIPHEPVVETIDLKVSDDDLQKISKTRKLALNLDEMRMIRDYFNDPDVVSQRQKVGLAGQPTDAELEVLAQTWSEHCKHKIFNANIDYNDGKSEARIKSLFNSFIKSSTETLKQNSDWVVSTLWDNSGVMKFNDDWLFCFKGETHNSPSNEEPYGGAVTGIVGVYRDPMGTGRGAKIIYATYGFCTGNPFYAGKLRPKIHPKRLLEGVRQGVQDGGNKHGVPTVFGFTFFDDGFMGKPAVYVLAAGIIPTKVNGQPGHLKVTESGDLIVMAGGRVGIDGIHGATESSMEAGEWISASHVQIGDPFTQKKLHDFLLEARDLGLFGAITDDGAGGLSSSVGEMAQATNGFNMELDKVPLKYAGLDPWQVLVSESQERMTLAVNPQNWEKFSALAKKHDVEATAIGTFNDSGKFHTTYQDKTVTFIDMEFAHGGAPRMELAAKWLSPEERGLREPDLPESADPGAVLKEILARINISGKEYIQRQYDHEVLGTSIVKPLVGANSDVFSDAAVVRPVYDTDEGIAVSAGINPKYGIIDTYWMAALGIDEAIRRIIAVGGNLKQIALNDNFCWPSPLPSPENPDAGYKMAQLVRANQALYDFTMAFKTPCISGKDSMSMDGTLKDTDGKSTRLSALPTILFSAAGKIGDVKKCVTMDAKDSGDRVYILGRTLDELGGSEFYESRGHVGSNVPKVDAQINIRLYNALFKAIDSGAVKSARGIYKGGLAVALAQVAFAGGRGLEINLDKIDSAGLGRADKLLYSESSGRFVVTVSPGNAEAFESMLSGNDIAFVGTVIDSGGLKIRYKGKTIIQEEIADLKVAWQSTFENF